MADPTEALLAEVGMGGPGRVATVLELARGGAELDPDPDLDQSSSSLSRVRPLASAIDGAHVACAHLLLSLGADPNGDPRRPPLAAAARAGSAPLVQALIDAGASARSAKEPDDGPRVPMFWAARAGDLPVLRALCDANASRSWRAANGRTASAARAALAANHWDAAALLSADRALLTERLRAEVDADLARREWAWLLPAGDDGFAGGDPEAVRALLAAGADPRAALEGLEGFEGEGDDECLALIRAAHGPQTPPAPPAPRTPPPIDTAAGQDDPQNLLLSPWLQYLQDKFSAGKASPQRPSAAGAFEPASPPTILRSAATLSPELLPRRSPPPPAAGGTTVPSSVASVRATGARRRLEALLLAGGRLDAGLVPHGETRWLAVCLVNRADGEAALRAAVRDARWSLWLERGANVALDAVVTIDDADALLSRDSPPPPPTASAPSDRQRQRQPVDPERGCVLAAGETAVLWLCVRAPEVAPPGPDGFCVTAAGESRAPLELRLLGDEDLSLRLELGARTGCARLLVDDADSPVDCECEPGETAVRTLAARNVGCAPLPLRVAVSPASSQFLAQPERLCLEPHGGMRSFRVLFSPSADADDSTATSRAFVALTSEDGLGRWTLPLVGRARHDAHLLVDCPVVDLGGAELGAERRHTVRICNAGSSSRRVTVSVASPGGPFMVEGASRLLLAPQQEAAVEVVFVPREHEVARGLLVLSVPGPFPRLSVPLFGYGGTSDVRVLSTDAGDGRSAGAGHNIISTCAEGGSVVPRLTLHNGGSRAAFVCLCARGVRAADGGGDVEALPGLQARLAVAPVRALLLPRTSATVDLAYSAQAGDSAPGLAWAMPSVVLDVVVVDEVYRAGLLAAAEAGAEASPELAPWLRVLQASGADAIGRDEFDDLQAARTAARERPWIAAETFARHVEAWPVQLTVCVLSGSAAAAAGRPAPAEVADVVADDEAAATGLELPASLCLPRGSPVSGEFEVRNHSDKQVWVLLRGAAAPFALSHDSIYVEPRSSARLLLTYAPPRAGPAWTTVTACGIGSGARSMQASMNVFCR